MCGHIGARNYGPSRSPGVRRLVDPEIAALMVPRPTACVASLGLRNIAKVYILE
jgi:hypothetical protein